MLAMGWDGVHLYLFRIGDTDYGDGFEDAPEIVDDREVRLRTVSGDGDTFAFIYDMGDSWEHDVATVEVVQPAAVAAPPHPGWRQSVPAGGHRRAAQATGVPRRPA